MPSMSFLRSPFEQPRETTHVVAPDLLGVVGKRLKRQLEHGRGRVVTPESGEGVASAHHQQMSEMAAFKEREEEATALLEVVMSSTELLKDAKRAKALMTLLHTHHLLHRATEEVEEQLFTLLEERGQEAGLEMIQVIMQAPYVSATLIAQIETYIAPMFPRQRLPLEARVLLARARNKRSVAASEMNHLLDQTSSTKLWGKGCLEVCLALSKALRLQGMNERELAVVGRHDVLAWAEEHTREEDRANLIQEIIEQHVRRGEGWRAIKVITSLNQVNEKCRTKTLQAMIWLATNKGVEIGIRKQALDLLHEVRQARESKYGKLSETNLRIECEIEAVEVSIDPQKQVDVSVWMQRVERTPNYHQRLKDYGALARTLHASGQNRDLAIIWEACEKLLDTHRWDDLLCAPLLDLALVQAELDCPIEAERTYNRALVFLKANKTTYVRDLYVQAVKIAVRIHPERARSMIVEALAWMKNDSVNAMPGLVLYKGVGEVLEEGCYAAERLYKMGRT